MTQDKKDFIETILMWFRTPKIGNDEEIDRAFLSDAYDSIAYPHWISVEDKLPSEGKYAVTINKVGAQDVRYYSYGKWYSNFGNEYDDITHWMPIPEAPKKGSEK